jgi:hypothetical protein
MRASCQFDACERFVLTRSPPGDIIVMAHDFFSLGAGGGANWFFHPRPLKENVAVPVRMRISLGRSPLPLPTD